MASRRSFLMLAHTYSPKKHKVKGWYASEKLDGIRALWDGGISRGLLKTEVPFANHEKDSRFVRPPIATGLWSRYGNIIHAPDWFLDQLPDYPLDGELFSDRRSWQTLSTVVKRIVPDETAWKAVSYNVFNLPNYSMIFQTGLINDPNFVKNFIHDDLYRWAMTRTKTLPRYMAFKQVVPTLLDLFRDHSIIKPIVQTPIIDEEDITLRLRDVLALGGEGIMLADPNSYWEAKRSHHLVKVKPENDDEAIVTGYVWGRQTDKGSKLLGMMGALVTDYKGKRFELSGFTDNERKMCYKELKIGGHDHAYVNGCAHPGEDVDNAFHNPEFPIGTVISFKYRELSDDGLPKEGRYWRKRN